MPPGGHFHHLEEKIKVISINTRVEDTRGSDSSQASRIFDRNVHNRTALPVKVAT